MKSEVSSSSPKQKRSLSLFLYSRTMSNSKRINEIVRMFGSRRISVPFNASCWEGKGERSSHTNIHECSSPHLAVTILAEVLIVACELLEVLHVYQTLFQTALSFYLKMTDRQTIISTATIPSSPASSSRTEGSLFRCNCHSSSILSYQLSRFYYGRGFRRQDLRWLTVITWSYRGVYLSAVYFWAPSPIRRR